MLTYTISVGDRSADATPLTDHEAGEMAQLGFRFSEFRPETGRYRLSPSYRTLHNLDRGTLTFQQAESGGRPARAAAPPPADAALFEPAAPAGVPAGAPAGAAPAAAGQGR